jgi:xanthine dehydrogenase accessory factor
VDTQDQQVLAAAQKWSLGGHRFALVTVAQTWGSSPRPPGAWMVLREDGMVHGSVSGGCVEDDLIRRMKAGELAGERPFRLDYGVTREEALHYGLPCGGRLELVVEPAPDALLLAELQHRIGTGQLVARTVDVGSAIVSLKPAVPQPDVSWNGRMLTTLHGPQWRLLVIGAGQISRYLAQMAQPLDYAVTVCDPRKHYSTEWDVAGAPWVPGYPDDVVLEMSPDPRTAIVALTHDPKLDDMALLEALKTPAFYVGALGSRANNVKRRERLLQYFDLTADQVERLHGPVGLSIGSRTPPEIAISILAEMTAVKRSAFKACPDESAYAGDSLGNGCGSTESVRVVAA